MRSILLSLACALGWTTSAACQEFKAVLSADDFRPGKEITLTIHGGKTPFTFGFGSGFFRGERLLLQMKEVNERTYRFTVSEELDSASAKFRTITVEDDDGRQVRAQAKPSAPPRPPDDWVKMTLPDQRFEIRFPAQPERRDEQGLEKDWQVEVRKHGWELEREDPKGVMGLIIYNLLPPNRLSAQPSRIWFDRIQQQIFKDGDATAVLASNSFKFADKYPARDVMEINANGAMRFRVRLVQTSVAVYAIFAAGSVDFMKSDVAKRFAESFKTWDEPAREPPTDAERVKLLIQRLQSPQVFNRLVALHALEKLGAEAKDATPFIERLAKEGSEDERLFAQMVLDRLQRTDATSWYMYGEAFFGKGDYDNAVANFTVSLGIDPRNAKARNYRGSAYFRKGELDNAIADYREALRLDPTMAVAHLNLGLSLNRKLDYDQAIPAFDQAIRLDPKLVLAFNGRGIAWFAKQDWEKAFADFKEYTRLNPQDPVGFLCLGQVSFRKGDFDSSIANFSEAIRINPKYADAFFERGQVWRAKGNDDQAIADYTEALQLKPQLPHAFLRRGEVWHKKKDDEKARADYEAVICLDSNNAQALNDLAWILATSSDAKLRDGAKALSLAKQAMALMETAKVMETLAAAYADTGDFVQAVTWQNRVLLDPTYVAADRNARVRLELYRNKKPYRE